jgi:hypothetical protein
VVIDKDNKQEIGKRLWQYVLEELQHSPRVMVEVKPYKQTRSQQQNRLMWDWYRLICRTTGQIMEEEELHEHMKARVLGFEEVIVPAFGKYPSRAYFKPKSTTKLSTKEMSEFLNAVEELAKQLNVVLYYPQDYQKIIGE